jgi:hypothetical protein
MMPTAHTWAVATDEVNKTATMDMAATIVFFMFQSPLNAEPLKKA